MMALVPKTPASDATYFRTLSVAAALALLLAGLSGGAVLTWTGGGANDNWSTGGNWGGTAPAPGDDLHFAGSTRLTPVNDIAGGNFNSITFDAGAGPFVVTGNAVTLTGGSIAITHGGAGNAAVNLPITLGTGSTFMNTSAGMLTLGGSITLGSHSLTVQAAGNTEMHGIISGSGYLTKTGGGTLKVSGSNTYSGTTTVSSGILILNGPSALGSAAGGVTVASGASLDLNGMNYSALEPLTLNGIGPSGIGALINSAASSATFGGPLTLGGTSSIIGESGPIVLTHTGAISGGYPLTLAGTQGGSISGAFASAALTKAGTGTWTLENDDSFTSLTLSSGTLHLGSGRAHIVFGSLNLAGGNLHFGSSALEFQGSSADFSSLASIVASGGTLGFASASAQAFMPKPGAAFPPIVKSGAGNLILNSYGLTAAGLALNGGTWDWSSYTHSLGSLASTSGNMLFNSSTVEITGDCDLSGLSSVAGAAAYLDFTGTGAQTFTPKAGGTTHPHVRKAGNGTLTLAGDLTTGSLLVSDGTFDLAAHSVIVNADLNVSGGTLRADDASLSVYASATISGGTLRMPADAMTVQQSFTAAASTLVHNSGTLAMTSSTTGRILDIDGAIHNLDLNGSGGAWTVSNHPLTMDGVLTLSAGYLVLGNSMAHSAGSLAFTAGSVDFGTASTMAVTSGNADFSGLTSLTMGAGNTLAFTAASGTQTFTPHASYGLHAVSKSGAGSVLMAGSPLIANGLSMSAGTWDWGASTLTHSLATLDATGGTMTFGSNKVKASGNVDLSGLAAINPGTGILWFDGSGSRTFTPKAGATHPKIDHSGAGVTTLTGNSLAAGALSMNGGTLNLGAGFNHAFASVGGTSGTLDFASSTLRVTSGDADFSGLAGLTAGTGVLEFTGTAAQNLTPHSGSGLPALKQNGAGGTTILTYGTTTPSITIASGTLRLGSGLAHASGNFASTGGGLDFQTSTLDLSGSTLDFSGLTGITPDAGTLGFQGSSPQTFTPFSGGVFPNLNKPGTGAVILAGALSAKALGMSNGTLALGSFTHSVASFAASGGTLDFGGSTLHVTEGQAYLGGLASLTPGTGTLDFNGTGSAQLLTPKSGATHPAVTHTGTAVLRLTDYGLISQGFSQSAGTLDFNNQNITTAGNFTITNGTPSSIASLGGAILTVTGNASFSGTSGAGKLNLNPGSAWTLAVTGALTGSFATLGNGSATVAAGSCSNCSNAGSNSNWSFATAWDGGGADENWSSALNWGSNEVPTSIEDVIFDATSIKNVTVNTAVSVKSLTMTPGYTGAFSFSASALTVTGDADFRSGGTIAAGTGSLVFTGTSGQVFHPKPGAVFPGIQQNGIGGTTVAGSAFSCGNLTLTSGTFNLGSGFTHTVASISGAGGLDFGTSNINATGATVNLSALTVSAAASNTLAFTGSGTTFTPKPTLTTLKLYVGGTANVLANGNITTPYLTLASGTLGLGTGRTHLVTNAIAISGGSLDFGSSGLQTASATLDLRNLAGLAPGTGNLQFTGASAQAFIPHASLPLPHIMQNGAGGTTVVTNPIISSSALSILTGPLHLGTGLVHTVASLGGTGGSGALDFGSSTLRIATGNASLNLVGSVTAGTGVLEFTAASGIQNFTPLSGYASPAISHSGAGTLNLAGTTTAASFYQTAGTFNLTGVNFSVTGNFTVANGNSASFAGLSGRTITVGGDAVINGTSPANRVNLNPVAAWTLAVTGDLNANLAAVAFSNASSASGSCTDCANGGNNINWNFSTVWSGGGADNLWSNALNWSGQTVPTSAENIVFNSTSLKNVLLDAHAGVQSLTFAPGYTGTVDFADKTLSVNGNADFAGGEILVPGSGALAFTGTSAQTFKPKTGAAFPAVIVNGAVGVTLTNTLASAGLTLTAGTLELGAGFTHSVGFVSGSGTLDFGASELEASGNVDVSMATVVPGAGTLRFSASSARTFSPKAGAVYPALVIAGSGILSVAGNGFTAPSLTLTAGTLNLGAGLVHAVTGALSITGGNLDFGSSELRVAGSTVDFGPLSTLIAGTGTLTFTGNSAQTLIPLAATAHPSVSHSGTGLLSIAGNLSAPALTIVDGGVHLGSGRTHALASLTATGGDLDFGTSTVNLTGAAADFSGLGTLAANSGKLVFTAATGSQILTPKAGSLHPAIEHNGSALLILDAADLVCASFLQQAGILDFNGRNLTVSGSGNLAIFNGGSNTLINLGGRTLTVGGAATLLGQPSDHLNLDPAAPWTLSVAGALKAVNADIRNSLAASSAGMADSSRNLAGNSNWTFLDTLLPENVTAFQATALDGHSVAMAWNASVAADADSVMLRFRSDGIPPQHAGDGALWRSVPAAKNADTATGMADKTVFHFAAFVRDSSGNFALKTGGSADSAATPDVTAPANVEAFTATAAGPTSAVLAWSASTSADVDSIVIRYRADGEYPSDASDGTPWKRLSASATGETVTGLSPNIVYHFAAFTADSSGNVAAASAQARDSALYQIPVSGSVSIADNQGRLGSPMAALAFTWSGADSLRFALPADTAAASWSGARALDSLSIAAGPDGLRVILAQFKNIYGLKSAWYRDTTLLDRTPPAVTLAANAEHSWRTWPDALSGKALDAGAGTDSVHVIRKRVADGAYFNGAGWSTVADTADLRADSVFSVPMPNSAMTTGAYDFTAIARDRIGNVSAPLTVRVNYAENRTPALASSTLADSLLQNQPAAWTLEIGDPDAGDSLGTLSATLPAWLTLTESADTAQGGFSARRIYSLAGKPQQADVGNATVTIRTVDLGGRIFTYTKAIKVVDANDPPLFAMDADSAYAQEDSVSGYRPVYADQDPLDVLTLSLVQAPAWVTLKDSTLVFKPGSRDAGAALVRVAVGDGKLADTLDLKVAVANVNDAPVAFPSTRFETRPDWKEDVADSFTVVVVDMDKGDAVTLVTVLPAWIGYQATVDPVDGFNRFFRFQVNPKQADTGSHPLMLSFRDASGAVCELPLSARVAAVNDTPTAVIKETRTLAGAARIALDVADHDGNAAATRFHYRLVAASGDTVRRGISAASILSLHPLADGAYRLAVRAEDEGGLKQIGFTTSDLEISGATAIGLDSARWSMIAYPGRSLPASALGSGYAVTTWDESSSDGSPLGRYATGPAADSLARGKGYWVRAARPVNLAAPLAELLDKPFSLKLTHGRQGWNQMGNPFPYFLDLSAAGLKFWEWDAVRRDLVDAKGILKPWGAYWVQVAKDTVLTLRDEPYFAPAQAASGALAKSAGPASPALRASDWTLQMFLQAGPYQDKANYLGIRNVTQAAGPAGAAGRVPGAAGQMPDAPKYGDYIALHFEKPATEAIGAKYATVNAAAGGARGDAGDAGFHAHDLGYAEDFRNGMGDDEVWWDFRVENSQTGFSAAALSVPGLENLQAAGLHAFLVRRGQAALLVAGEPAILAMEGRSTPYSIVVTPHADFAGRMRGDFSISQNFPNPVRTHTTFRFALPQTWDASGRREARSYRLRLNVYDYSGRLAARVAEGVFKPGAHSLVWKPQALNGGDLAKGAYVYRLEVPGFSKSLKLLLK